MKAVNENFYRDSDGQDWVSPFKSFSKKERSLTGWENHYFQLRIRTQRHELPNDKIELLVHVADDQAVFPREYDFSR